MLYLTRKLLCRTQSKNVTIDNTSNVKIHVGTTEHTYYDNIQKNPF